jgi:hypothetical protein
VLEAAHASGGRSRKGALAVHGAGR